MNAENDSFDGDIDNDEFKAMLDKLPPVDDTERRWQRSFYVKWRQVTQGEWGRTKYRDIDTCLPFKRYGESEEEYIIRLLKIVDGLEQRAFVIKNGNYASQEGRDKANDDLQEFKPIQEFIEAFRLRKHDGTEESYRRVSVNLENNGKQVKAVQRDKLLRATLPDIRDACTELGIDYNQDQLPLTKNQLSLLLFEKSKNLFPLLSRTTTDYLTNQKIVRFKNGSQSFDEKDSAEWITNLLIKSLKPKK